MTAIAPNTTVWLVNTLLTSGSEDTFYFPSLADQTAYFEARKLIGLTNYTYQREQRHFIKVGVNGSDMARVIKNANYMMWKNSSYEDKNYYAFITEAEWINNEVVKLYFEMDYIQTYFFNYVSPTCYIVRQHSETDNIGDNILPEPVEIGEYVSEGNHRCQPDNYGYRDFPCIVLVETNSDQTQAVMIDGVFTGCKYTVFPFTPNGIQAVQAIINTHKEDPDWLLALYMTRYVFVGIDPEYTTPRVLATSEEPVQYTITIPEITTTDRLNGYSPKNKKLYTYPYTFLNVNNCKGNDINLRYEFWNSVTGGGHQLLMYCTRGLPVTMQIRPYSYKGETSSDGTGSTQGASSDVFVETNSFPLGSWSMDSYQIWQAQNQGNMAGSAIQTVEGVAKSVVAGVANPVAGAFGAFDSLSATIQWAVQGYNASIKSDRFSGTLAGSSIQWNTKLDIPVYRRMSVQAQYARAIDDFFTMYGYTQNKIATPNRHARTRYTYVRTVGFNPIANIPQEARKFIATRYDNGIRFWVDHESNTFCNYTTDNLPLS